MTKTYAQETLLTTYFSLSHGDVLMCHCVLSNITDKNKILR